MVRLRMLNKIRKLEPTTLVLAAILLVALALRLYGVWFGLPFPLHDDEPNEVLRALQLGAGSYNYERIGKGGYFYLLFVEYGVLFVILKFAGVIQTATDFAKYYIYDPTAFYLIGRSTTAIIGVINVGLVYKIGRLAYSPLAGLVAAGLLGVNILHTQVSHYVTVDVPMVCLATASLYFAIKMLYETRSRNYYFSAAFAALATSTKLPAILLILPLVIAHSYHVANFPNGSRFSFFSRPLLLAIATFLSAYVIATPGILIYFEGVALFVLNSLGLFIENSADSVGPIDPRYEMFSEFNYYRYYIEKIMESMTLPVFLVCLLGLAWGLWRRRQSDIVLVSFAIVVFVFAALTSTPDMLYPRYILPVIPVLVVLGGMVVTDMTNIPFIKKKALVGFLATSALALIPMYRIVIANQHLVMPDTRIIAREWIHQNISPGSKIFIEGATVRPIESTVPLQYSKKNILEGIEHFRDTNPGKARYFELELQVLESQSPEKKTYDLVSVHYFGLEPLQSYIDGGVEYFILRPDAYGPRTKHFDWPIFVSEIRSNPRIRLLKKFQPNHTSTRGPMIEIYSRTSSSNLNSEYRADED